MRSVRFLPIIFAAIAVYTIAQENTPSAEEILRFFPMDDYEQIIHEETAALLAAKQFETFERYGGFGWDRKMAPFPEEFMNEAESITTARKVRVFVYVRKEDDTGFRKNRGSRMAFMKIGDVRYAAEGAGEDLYVLRFLDLPAVLKKYGDAGGLAETGEAIGENAVYSIQRKDGRGLERTMYLVSIETGELLAAENLKMLKRMVAVGRGEEVSILGDPTYLTFEDALEYDGQSFRWGTIRHIQSSILKYAEKQEHSAEDIEKARNSLVGRYYIPVRVYVWELSDPAIAREIQIFDSEEAAREQLDRLKEGKIRASGYSKVIMDARQHSVDGNKVIATTTYDDDTTKKLDEAREQMIRESEQRKKDEKEKDDDDK